MTIRVTKAAGRVVGDPATARPGVTGRLGVCVISQAQVSVVCRWGAGALGLTDSRALLKTQILTVGLSASAMSVYNSAI